MRERQRLPPMDKTETERDVRDTKKNRDKETEVQ
ncbi:unnamed protein product [Brassica oleracea]